MWSLTCTSHCHSFVIICSKNNCPYRAQLVHEKCYQLDTGGLLYCKTNSYILNNQPNKGHQRPSKTIKATDKYRQSMSTQKHRKHVAH